MSKEFFEISDDVTGKVMFFKADSLEEAIEMAEDVDFEDYDDGTEFESIEDIISDVRPLEHRIFIAEGYPVTVFRGHGSEENRYVVPHWMDGKMFRKWRNATREEVDAYVNYSEE